MARPSADGTGLVVIAAGIDLTLAYRRFRKANLDISERLAVGITAINPWSFGPIPNRDGSPLLPPQISSCKFG